MQPPCRAAEQKLHPTRVLLVLSRTQVHALGRLDVLELTLGLGLGLVLKLGLSLTGGVRSFSGEKKLCVLVLTSCYYGRIL